MFIIFRVDAVYGDTLKIASGLGQSTKQDNEKEGDGDHSQDDQVPTNEWRKLSDQYALPEKNKSNYINFKHKNNYSYDKSEVQVIWHFLFSISSGLTFWFERFLVFFYFNNFK